MKLSDLFFNRFLYRQSQQNLETKDAVYDASNVIPAVVPPLASGGAAQDINISNVTINGDVITPGTFPPSLLDVANWGWGQTLVFSSTNLNTVIWTATAPNNNTFKSANGAVYTIVSGTTGVMAEKTYIYLDLNVSNSAYQITTNPSLAVGLGKVLIAVAQNAAVETPQPNATYNLNEATQITADNILANTINASKMNVGQLSAISADLGAITAGTITLDTAGYIRGGQTAYNTGTGFFLGYSGGTHKFSMGNGSTKLFTYDGTDFTLVGGNITGGTLRTAVSGARVEIGAGVEWINFYDATASQVIMYANAGNFLIQGQQTTSDIRLIAGTNGEVDFWTGTTLRGYISDVSLYIDVPTSIYLKQGGLNRFKADYLDVEITAGSSSELGGNVKLGVGSGAGSSQVNLSKDALYPVVGSVDLGTSSYKYKDLYLSGVANIGSLSTTGTLTTGDVIAHASDSHNLGSTSYYWNNLYTDYVRFNSTYGQIYWGSDLILDIYSGYTIWKGHFDPYGAGSYNLGGATRYWNDVSYKTLTDRGCLGWFDDGVELQDGTIVTDLGALENIKKHPTLKTIYGTPRLDYKSMPKCVYRKASSHDGTILERDKDDKPFIIDKDTKEKIYAEDGAETTALISIMLGSIKELSAKVKKLESIKK